MTATIITTFMDERMRQIENEKNARKAQRKNQSIADGYKSLKDLKGKPA